mmetsp:Transcript_19711/g.54151  ORF Transcript_19711/g.54151 Transcript_19711/m.54151 type:complete len:273 (+) Transcript_19711:113-931(+)
MVIPVGLDHWHALVVIADGLGLLANLDIYQVARLLWHAVCPRWHVDFLEAIIRQGEKLQHWHDEIRNVLKKVAVVFHVSWANEKLPAATQAVQLDTVLDRHESILLAVNDQGRCTHARHAILVGKAFVQQVSEDTNIVVQDFLDRQKRRDEDQTGDFVLDRQRNGRAGANGATEDLDAVGRPMENLAHEAESSERALGDRLSGRNSMAEAIARIFDRHDVHLEVFPNGVQEGVALPDVLCVAVQVKQQVACRWVLQEEARHALLQGACLSQI